MTTTEELQRELADASRVIGALICKLDQANETIEGLEATIESLRHERDRERALTSRNWDALSDRIARMEEAGDDLRVCCESVAPASDVAKCVKRWTAAKEAKP
jgi:predicted  nucleic acid-binding Zn-ribbon protein